MNDGSSDYRRVSEAKNQDLSPDLRRVEEICRALPYKRRPTTPPPAASIIMNDGYWWCQLCGRYCNKSRTSSFKQRCIWKIKLQRDISQRLTGCLLQVVWRIFTGYLQSGIHVSTMSFYAVSNQFLRFEKKMHYQWMDLRTHRRTDQRTDGQSLI